MCRWFAYISSTEECLLEDVLIAPAHALSKQVHDHYLPKLFHHEPDKDREATQAEIALRNRVYNTDGLGVAWYGTVREQYGECEGPRPTLYKIVRQPLTDPNFLSICANTSTLALFAHIRAASGETAITEYNAHPFRFGRWVFMHNGVVAHFNLIKRQVCAEISHEAFQLVSGTTDSEHLAALIFTYLEAEKGPQAWEVSHSLDEIKAALENAITKIIQLQKQTVSLAGVPLEASSLNVAVTDGTQLLAIRFRNHPTEHPPSLYLSTKAGVKLNRKFPGHPDRDGDNGAQNLKATQEHGAHVIVCSEPTTYKASDWELVGKNECLMVGTDMVMRRENVNVDF
ncbi:hypothetical protein EUX98_g7282 [Antrodiella citrinella]|uniref:Glutamine amidotransferase type-2 domain-containing protein n=1 Tax=Antrodiella citrinella TaxID=2447956 RepID=A0A4S4MNM5_9APHY|nr:hypothetical protein EUX98_g7282 [Antrodiella citrinella]